MPTIFFNEAFIPYCFRKSWLKCAIGSFSQMVQNRCDNLQIEWLLLILILSCLYVCMFVCLYVCMFACLLVCLFACLLVYLFACF